MSIRLEKPADTEGIRRINLEAFETQGEAKLVDMLRDTDIHNISLVYEEKGELCGHIFFTPVELVDDTSGLRIMGLAPMAVLPKMQNKGIGSSLVEAGIEDCRSEDYDAIAVLGHPNFYQRFGFVPSVNYGINSEYDVPDDVFMMMELKEGSLKDKKGIIKYHEIFSAL